jgi:insulysin
MGTKVFEELEKSVNDKRSYRHLTLSNALEVMLVHDPEAQKSAACCDVRIGSFADPPEAQGLADFLEHMLFLGTDKYPDENSYNEFLTEHGGGSNAFTSQEDTVYFFYVQNDFLEPALDRFASFFTGPLFTSSATEREGYFPSPCVLPLALELLFLSLFPILSCP